MIIFILRFPKFEHTFAKGLSEWRLQNERCNAPPAWGRWSDKTTCSKSCDTGTKTRTRDCLLGNVVSNNLIVPDNAAGRNCGCRGAQEEVVNCNEQCCVQWMTCDRSRVDGAQLCATDANFIDVYRLGDPFNFDRCEEKPLPQCGPQV